MEIPFYFDNASLPAGFQKFLLGVLSMLWSTFSRSFTSKKPLFSTRAKEVFLLYHKIEYGIIISTTQYV